MRERHDDFTLTVVFNHGLPDCTYGVALYQLIVFGAIESYTQGGAVTYHCADGVFQLLGFIVEEIHHTGRIDFSNRRIGIIA